MRKPALGVVMVIVLTSWLATWAQEARREGRRVGPPQGSSLPTSSPWEYKAMTRFDIVKLAPKPVDEKADDVEPIRGWPVNPKSLTQGLNVLGDQGWELVAIEPHFQISQGDITVHYGPTYIMRKKK